MSRSSAHAFLRICRLIHLYLGIFTAPALIFFAFTGALQTFSLHETTRGSSYKPPAWAVTLGQIHKKQTPVVPVRKRPVETVAAPDARAEGRAPHFEEPRTDPGTDSRADSRSSELRTTPAVAAPSPAGLPTQQAPAGKKHHPLPLKIFFLIVAIGLFLSTVTGIYMSYKYMRNRVMVTALLVLGTILPVALVFV
ncbi:PepSY domain-containing protein [Edaphobacter sp. 12200R-103]|jgi:hypothetical protein|uniref:PepSY domain-containing protein n=1 Tax=Edaphobacter sp. 12200R-103 TaxID=2703788 RepID=UPI00138D4D89|nr:PepSY domain-containing protein [Edaphobacter sp. 12200R-103]QHS50476.1 PepSY domain-containing protein [Edaphobacter sp. 12200R-103]